MARITLSEYTAKRLLLGNTYQGHMISTENADHVLKELGVAKRYVFKVDQGVKKRHKQGLLAVDIGLAEVAGHMKAFTGKGYQRFLLEPFVAHESSEERYLSMERVREGVSVLYSQEGGVEVEEAGDRIQQFLYDGQAEQLQQMAARLGIATEWLTQLVERFNQLHISFIEVNPLLVQNGQPLLLDCAVQVDSAAAYFVEEWSLADDVTTLNLAPAEQAVAQLAANSASSFSLKVVHPNGGLGMLLSGGGASVAIADEACNLGQADNLLNYGEYSGNPTPEETSLYTAEVLKLLLDSKAPKKALIIAGGVANFTDIKQTFKGVIEALEIYKDGLREQRVKVFVRRGGPNEAEGLATMRAFLKEHELYGEVSGSESLLTQAVASAVEYIR